MGASIPRHNAGDCSEQGVDDEVALFHERAGLLGHTEHRRQRDTAVS